MSTKKVIKVLTIDGGGVRGLIPALILNALSKDLQKPIHEYFDLIAGTSTGSLISLLLTVPMTSHTSNQNRTKLIVDLYENESQHIFSQKRKTLKMIKQIFMPKYPSTYIKTISEKYFKDYTLKDSLTNLLIPAFDMQKMQPFFFKHRPCYNDCGKDLNFYLKDVALGAIGAPTYLPPAKIKSLDTDREFCFVDGGLYANNPSLCAYIETIKLFPDAEKIIFVSLGTGKIQRSYKCKSVHRWGLWGWVSPFKSVPLLSSFMYGQEGNAHYMLGKTPNSQIYRLNPTLLKGSDIDDSSNANIAYLQDLTYQYLAENDHILRNIAKVLSNE